MRFSYKQLSYSRTLLVAKNSRSVHAHSTESHDHAQHFSLRPSITADALVLLQHFNAFLPAAQGLTGSLPLDLALAIASEVICDDTYSNKSWAITAGPLRKCSSFRLLQQLLRSSVMIPTRTSLGILPIPSQGMFSLQEDNRIGHEKYVYMS